MELYSILELLANLFLNPCLLLPPSNPTACARARIFIDVVTCNVETPLLETSHGVSGAFEKMFEGLVKIWLLLPNPNAAESGEYATGKDFTNADYATVPPLLASCELAAKMEFGRSGNPSPGPEETREEIGRGEVR